MQAGAKLPPKYDVGQIGRRGIGRGVNFYSSERERKMGDALAAEMERSMTVIHDPLIDGYLNRVVQNLVDHSEVGYKVSIRLVYDNEDVNAQSLPGGHLYMTSSMLLALESESELAMVMAHEIAHVAARHDTRSFTREILWDLPFFPLLRIPGTIGYSVRQVTWSFRSMPVLKFDRGTEHEADLLGLEYAYSAGYDPEGMLNLYQRFAMQDSRPSSFFSRLFATHPRMTDRLHRAKSEIVRLLPPRTEYVQDTSDFHEAKQRLLDIVIERQRSAEASAPAGASGCRKFQR